MGRPRRRPDPPWTVLLSGAVVRGCVLDYLGWDRAAIERALARPVPRGDVAAVEDARRRQPSPSGGHGASTSVRLYHEER